jgi:hypothetical protein
MAGNPQEKSLLETQRSRRCRFGTIHRRLDPLQKSHLLVSLSLEFGLSARGVWVCDGLRREKGKMERSYVHGEEERRKRENGEGLLCVVRERERGRKERKRKRKWKRVTCVGGEKCVVCWKCERIRWECVFTKVP